MADLNNLSFEQLVPSKSKYLAKEDAGEDGLILTVKGVRMETLETDEGNEDKVVLHFQENVKPMVLNRTNAQLLGLATGAKTAGEAKGKKIVVYSDPTVVFGGKPVGGLRIKKVSGTPKPAKDELNDDIPF
jgi:hypothetical protein